MVSRPPLDEHGGPRNRMVIRLDEYQGHRYLDVRFWYLNKKNDEWCRTKKGVTLNRDRHRVLREALERHEDEIRAWLDEQYVPEEITRYEEAQHAALTDATFQPLELVVDSYAERRDPRFFDVTHEGGRAVVSFNSSHPAVAQLAEQPAAVQEFLGLVMLAFDRARRMLDGAPALDARTLLNHLVDDWGKYLRDAGKRL